jgi:membrane-bound lytic murein transglycosylase D
MYKYKSVIICVFISILLFCCFIPKISSGDNFSEQFTQFTLYKYIPDSLTFCGEKVPLENPYVKEKLEREILLISDRVGQNMLYLKRSGRFFPLIENRLRKDGLPADLKFISVAESALLNLVSVKGAGGYWQLMEGTAKQNGLKINDYIDERYNIFKSTDAAFKYLKYLYSVFNNWTLAVAAYNVGPNNIKDNLDFQWENSYYDLFLNEETSRFIFRILAIKVLFNEPKKFGIYLSDRDYYRPYNYRLKEVDGEIPNLTIWAKREGTNYAMVKSLNPWILNRHLPEGNYTIILPAEAKPQEINEDNYPYKEKSAEKKKKKKK